MLGFFVVALDAQIVNGALPDIGDALGMGIFVLASAVCGFAPTLGVLVAGRVAQGEKVRDDGPPAVASWLDRVNFTTT